MEHPYIIREAHIQRLFHHNIWDWLAQVLGVVRRKGVQRAITWACIS